LHKHRVEDTRKRSLLKALTGNGLEIVFDTFIFGYVFIQLGIGVPEAIGIGFGLSVMTEILCFVTNYFNDRLWNRTQFGRKVRDIWDTSTTPLTKEEIEMWEKLQDEDWEKFKEENNL